MEFLLLDNNTKKFVKSTEDSNLSVLNIGGFGSDALKNELADRLKPDSNLVLNLAYTDYGGSFMDKVVISYFIKKHRKNIVWEDTIYNGRNAYIFGDIVKELNNYNIFMFEGVEDYYLYMEEKEKRDALRIFFKDNRPDYIIKKTAYQFALNNWDNYNLVSSGLDFSESDLIDFLISNEQIKKRY